MCTYNALFCFVVELMGMGARDRDLKRVSWMLGFEWKLRMLLLCKLVMQVGEKRMIPVPTTSLLSAFQSVHATHASLSLSLLLLVNFFKLVIETVRAIF